MQEEVKIVDGVILAEPDYLVMDPGNCKTCR
jgi:hypothetical protein